MIKFRQKNYTLYDETDNLKRMKDSDILAEKKKPTTRWGQIAGVGAAGAVAGGLGGAAIGSIGKAVRGRTMKGFGSNLVRGAKKGAILTGAAAAGVSYLKGRKQATENAKYNERLAYAQRQAGRRERRDWKTNMTQRDGYSY